MIGLFAKLVGPKLAPFIAYATLVIAVLLILWWLRADAYADGVKDTDAKWAAASAAMQNKVIESSTTATVAADARTIQEIKKVEIIKEKLDEADRNNTSSLDVLFGN